jgi:imidazolonepropionase-like amidohydrolase
MRCRGLAGAGFPARLSRHALVLAMAIALPVSGCGGPAPSASPQNLASAGGATLALVHGKVIDGTGAAPVPDGVVLIAGDRILATGPADRIEVPSDIRTLDVNGATILPGFINAHVHGGFVQANLRAWAEGGVTTVRDESAGVGQILNLQTARAVIDQNPHLARLISAGTMLAVPGGYGYLYVDSPEQARAAVLTEIDEGVDAIKVALEDGYAGAHGLPKPTAEELRAIVETAHAAGLPVSGHITQGAYLRPMLDAGVDDIAHLPYDSIPADSIAAMVQRGVYLIPTFTVLRNYGNDMDACAENLRQIVAAGGKVALGNDFDGGPGDFELGIPMFEIEMMSKAGMTPMEIVEAATANGSHVLNLAGEIGTLEAGKAADLLVVGGDPLTDLHALENVQVVVHGGAVIRDEVSFVWGAA